MKCFKKPEKRGAYLVCFYNEKHEKVKVNQYEGLEKKFKEALGQTNEKIENIEKMVSENFQILSNYIQEMNEKKAKEKI